MAAGDLTGAVTNTPSLPAAVFDGVDDYIDVPHIPQLLGTNLSAGFTISCWIKLRSTGEGVSSDSGYVIGNHLTEGFNFTCRQDSGKMQFWMDPTMKMTETTAITLKSWVHYIITVSGATPAIGNLYKNNVQGTATSVDLGNSYVDIITTTALRIGNNQGSNTRTLDGQVAKLRMWNRVLSAAERTADYEGKIVNDGLIMNYELNGNAQDSSQFANDGTVSGAFFTNVDFNNIIADVRERNLAAVTDKLLVVPNFGRNGMVSVISANREA